MTREIIELAFTVFIIAIIIKNAKLKQELKLRNEQIRFLLEMKAYKKLAEVLKKDD